VYEAKIPDNEWNGLHGQKPSTNQKLTLCLTEGSDPQPPNLGGETKNTNKLWQQTH